MQTLNQSAETEKKFIAADLEKCTGCGTCELVCAIKRENVYNPSCSRIKILRLYQLANMAIACRLCEKPPCVIACPLDCLVQSEKTGVILVNEEKCDCCGWCIGACPYGAIMVNPEKETVMICDLCGGDPQCVEWCPEEALKLVTEEGVNENVRKATENILIKEKLRLSETLGEVQFEKEKPKKIEKTLNLLIEAFSETNPTEILIYGMFAKKSLSPIIPKSKEKIEKTLELLSTAIKVVEKNVLTKISSHNFSDAQVQESRKERGG
jgi:anaerobic carbon-monoxide dehydrogenase iron sulfur subunit